VFQLKSLLDGGYALVLMEIMCSMDIEAELFHLYIDPISNFSDPLFDDFTKLL
jgi:hypothetical protein